ncbi:MAG: RNA-binding protein [Gammaproteobacteria bacterium]|nr:RNA-binding protein [Gammaproteobacteria bacterium]
MNIYVGNLPYSVKSRELREAFEAYGTVTSAEVIIDRRTKRSRGYGFVEMDSDQDGRRAIQELNGRDFMGRELRVDESQPRDQKPERRAEHAPERDTERPRAAASTPAASSAGGGIVGFFKRLLG